MRLPVLILVLLSACSVDHTGLGPDIDASVAPCTSASDCDLGDPCTTYACDDGVCSATGCGFGLVCDGTSCVPRSSCDPGLCETEGRNPARCAIGECRGDLCASVVTCGEETLCCNEGCVDCPVDEADPCMQPACDGSACGKEPRPAGTPCNVNGNFCEGFGTCNDVGECNVGLEMCGRECDEEALRCVGCLEDDDCPPTVTNNNCAAELGDNDCTAQVTPSRTVFSCEDNMCVRGATSDDPVIRCNQPNGFVCAESTSPGFGPCVYGSDCILTGVASQDRSDWFCERGNTEPFAAAGCTETLVPLEERDSCGRSTDGRTCSTPPAATTFGSCGGYMGMCDETGTQSVSTYASSCDSGSCDTQGSTVAPFMRSCSRSRDGNPCNGGDEDGDWSACMFVNATDCSGTQTRTLTRRMCGSDTCQETTETDSQTCDRPNSPLTLCGSSGTCMPGGSGNFCIGEQTTPICVNGSCDMGNTVACDLVGRDDCEAAEDGACGGSGGGDVCMGERTPVTYACIAGGVCEATNLMPVSCPLTGNACGDDTMCTGGSCNVGVCERAVDCSTADACGGGSGDGGCNGMQLCTCDGSNACECT